MKRARAAIRQGDARGLRALLRDEPELTRKPQLVLDACKRAHLGTFEVLEAAGADLNAIYRGYRPLHALMQETLHAKADPPSKERLECLDWLLAHGADPELAAAWPPSRALLVAAFCGEGAYVERLRAVGARVDFFVHCALGDLPAVRTALARSRELATARDGGTLTALQCASASRMGREQARTARNLVAIAALLLDAGADVRAQTKSWSHAVDAPYFAASSGQLETFRLLLECGADASAALVPALWNATEEFAELALAHGAKPDRAEHEGKPLLNQLVRWGQVRQALWLMQKGASPDLPDERGWTAVHQAASRGNERMLRAALAAGGDRTARSKEGQTPVDVARQALKPNMLAILGEG